MPHFCGIVFKDFEVIFRPISKCFDIFPFVKPLFRNEIVMGSTPFGSSIFPWSANSLFINVWEDSLWSYPTIWWPEVWESFLTKNSVAHPSEWKVWASFGQVFVSKFNRATFQKPVFLSFLIVFFDFPDLAYTKNVGSTVLHTVGRGFESLFAHHFSINPFWCILGIFQNGFYGPHFFQMHVRSIGLIHPALERIWTKEGADSCRYRTIADKISL